MISLGLDRISTPKPRKRHSDVPGWDNSAGFVFDNGVFYADTGQENLRTYIRHSPAMAICSRVYALLLKTSPLTLVRPDGTVLRWPPKDRRQLQMPGMQILRLWSEEPNRIQTREQFLDTLALDWIYNGEVVARIFRAGTDTPTEIFVVAAERVNVTGYSYGDVFTANIDGPLVYHYGRESISVDLRRPQIMHLRANVDPRYQIRGRPAVWNMTYEVKANALASIYRSEVYRQGGPVRTGIQAAEDYDPTEALSEEDQIRIAEKLGRRMKRSESWMKDVTVLPTGFKFADYGPKTADEMYVQAARLTDEKISAVHGVPLLYQGNMENSTYNNSRQQVAVLIQYAGASMFAEIESAIRRNMLPVSYTHLRAHETGLLSRMPSSA